MMDFGGYCKKYHILVHVANFARIANDTQKSKKSKNVKNHLTSIRTHPRTILDHPRAWEVSELGTQILKAHYVALMYLRALSPYL